MAWSFASLKDLVEWVPPPLGLPYPYSLLSDVQSVVHLWWPTPLVPPLQLKVVWKQPVFEEIVAPQSLVRNVFSLIREALYFFDSTPVGGDVRDGDSFTVQGLWGEPSCEVLHVRVELLGNRSLFCVESTDVDLSSIFEFSLLDLLNTILNAVVDNSRETIH